MLELILGDYGLTLLVDEGSSASQFYNVPLARLCV